MDWLGDVAGPFSDQTNFIRTSPYNELFRHSHSSGVQSVKYWVDCLHPQRRRAGIYQGSLVVQQNGKKVRSIPVKLLVRNFTLPDTPTAKVWLFLVVQLSNGVTNGSSSEPDSPEGSKGEETPGTHFLMAHRHRIALTDVTVAIANP